MGNEIEFLVSNLSSSSRRGRQTAASVLAQVARDNVSEVIDCSDALIEALNCAESQTRWECLNALTEIAAQDPARCDAALGGAETGLFDDDSGLLRLAAMRFLCMYGSSAPERSDKVWPLIDEAIQCCHGDAEFPEMMNVVLHFSEGSLSDAVREQLASRMAFDAKNARGALKRRAQQILDNTSK